ncbi:MAG: DUF945 domain-containing protein [Paludibacteraceae bacterium]|nr:DUF945 domain-containing protein [Paludibacteraceae bacterium]
MAEIINFNNGNVITETGAREVSWNLFGKTCPQGTTIHDVFADMESDNRINFGVSSLPIMRVPQEVAEAIAKGMPMPSGYTPSANDIITTHKATMRDDTRQTLGVVGNAYGIVQNEKAFEFMDFIKEAANGVDPNITCYGALGHGERIFVTATLGEDSYISKDDAVKNYVVFTNSHDGSGSVMAFFTPVRVVCQNTLNMAIKKCANKVSFKHTSRVDERLDWSIERNRKIAAELFSKSVRFTDAFIERMIGLKAEDVNAEYIRDFVGKLTLTPTTFDLWRKADYNADKVEEISTKSKNIMANMTDAIENGVGQDMYRGTKLWLMNGVTTYFQNTKSWKDEEDKFNSLMFGNTKRKVDEAFTILAA